MPYTVTLTNGNVLTVIADETADNTTSLTLLGKNYAGYGTILADNFVRLLESAANTSPPSVPLIGQLWYDTSKDTLKVWNGVQWMIAGLPGNSGPINQPIIVEGTTTDNVGFIVYDPAAPPNSRYYRIRVRDDDPYAGHWVLESLYDNMIVKTVILDTGSYDPAESPDKIEYMKLALTPPPTDNSTALATTAFVKQAISNLTSSQIITALGFTPVQQGGGKLQQDNKLYVGWDGTSLRAQVDSTDLGELALMSQILTLIGAALPRGMITLWYGAIAAVPSGWHLCDGTNGTPNLRDRFIVGAGNAYAPGAVGGSTAAIATGVAGGGGYLSSANGNHAHTTDSQGGHGHNIGSTGLTIDQMAWHDHNMLSSTGTPYVVCDAWLGGGGTGQFLGSGPFPAGEFLFMAQGSGWGHSHSIDVQGWHSHTTSASGDHQHWVTINDHAHTVPYQLPPYYALAYIMKL